MYGTNVYKRLDVDYPTDAPITKQPDANLSNYNTQLSRTVLHDENRYSDTQIRPRTSGKYEYVHAIPTAEDEGAEHATNLAQAAKRGPQPGVDWLPTPPTPTQAPYAPSEQKPPVSTPDPVVESPRRPVVQATEAPRPHAPQAPQADELRAVEVSNHRKLVHDTKSSIMEKKENYRKCKRRNRLLLFVFVIVLFLLFAVVRRMGMPK
jgi:hypothetical protein